MVLYSGTTCPFSQRCRFVLFEKGMDFEIRDVDLFNKPEDISVMNPYGQVPILVERDLILYESNIINEYIDERFPHPQLMPADPVMRYGWGARIAIHPVSKPSRACPAVSAHGRAIIACSDLSRCMRQSCRQPWLITPRHPLSPGAGAFLASPLMTFWTRQKPLAY